MKLGILADTHDHLDNTRDAVEAFKARGVTHLLHCGDIIAPFVLPIIGKGGFDECYAVYGNNDGEWLMLDRLFKPLGALAKPPYFFKIGALRVALLHEPMPDDVMDSLPVDLVAFGHTHDAVVRHGPPLIVNPGECCGYLTGKATVAVVDTETMQAELIELEKHE